ncbi:NF-kappa-B inhibitor beta [Scleropages formosus]|uniref:NF-kappa-B inhibitor alpha n=1 Tax=Scleropages formosus TaxID=113540 RepID=A0A8C9SXF4_SCLFO|nr:NF-kappa-B inhibitor beta [Scleropages formosus]
MEGVQRQQGVHAQPGRDVGGTQRARPQLGIGCALLEKQQQQQQEGCSRGVDAAPAEDWCDSGLESFNSGPLSADGLFHTSTEGGGPAWKSSPDLTDSCAVVGSSPRLDGQQPADSSCVSLGGGERLDSALGHSITDEMLGCISQGIGSMQLSEDPEERAPAEAQVETTTFPTQEIFNTLSFVSEDGDTALHLALIHEHWSLVHNLLGVISLDRNWTPYLDIQNHLGQTALHLAVIVDQSECVRALLYGGASPELQERGGNTPLHLAVREARVNCVRELASGSHRPDHLRVTNYSGVSALHLAVQKGNENVVQMLLDAGADVNQRDLSSGRSPLHWAVESQSPWVVRQLLRAGAAVDQPSYAGHSPLYCALHRPNKDVQALLREGGGTDVHSLEDDDEEDLESEEEEFDDLIINGHPVL